MTETLEVGGQPVELVRKAVKNVHLSVHPPNGRVTLVVPTATRQDVARTYVASRLGWIRKRQEEFRTQRREPGRQFVARESHQLWGKRYLLRVDEREAPPEVQLDHRRILLGVRPGSTHAQRAAVMDRWHRELLHREVPRLIALWEPRLGVEVSAYALQRMKTKWGSCNPRARRIRLNTELVKKPKDLLEYVVVHEMAHLRQPNHGPDFVALLDTHVPAWREARAELNALIPDDVSWRERT